MARVRTCCQVWRMRMITRWTDTPRLPRSLGLGVTERLPGHGAAIFAKSEARAIPGSPEPEPARWKRSRLRSGRPRLIRQISAYVRDGLQLQRPAVVECAMARETPSVRPAVSTDCNVPLSPVEMSHL